MFSTTQINKGFIGLVFKNDDYDTFLQEGSHFLWNKEVRIYKLSELFSPPVDIEILLKDTAMAAMLDIINVGDNEKGLLYEEGRFKYVLQPGRYIFWKNQKERNITIFDLTDYNIPDELDKNLLGRAELQPYIRTFTVEPTEQALFYVNYEFTKVVGPGQYYFWKNETVITILTFDLRQQQLEILGQEILTKDKANVRMNFLCIFKTIDIKKAGLEVKNPKEQLYTLLQLALREYTGSFTLDELLATKEEIGNYILEKTKDGAASMGMEIMSAGVKDIILPGDIKEILNQVLIAEKKAQANIVTRREETASTRSLLNTAKLMEDNPLLYKLKELEYVERLSEKITQINISGGGHILEQLSNILVGEKKKNG